MQILLIGDFHGKLPKKLLQHAKKADIVLTTGDFAYSKKLKALYKKHGSNWKKQIEKNSEIIDEDYQAGKKIIEQLSKTGTPTYTVMGNWDYYEGNTKYFGKIKQKYKSYPKLIKKLPNIHDVERKTITINNNKITGFGGFIVSTLYTKNYFNKEKTKYYQQELKKYEEELKKIQQKTDILLSHYPPLHFFDQVKTNNPKNKIHNKHIGWKAYNNYIQKNQPTLFICGHMHDEQGTAKIGKTTIISTGPAYQEKGYLITYKNKEITKLKKI